MGENSLEIDTPTEPPVGRRTVDGSRAPGGWSAFDRWLARLLLVTFVAFLVAVAVAGQRSATFDTLRAGLGSGDISAVTVEGDDMTGTGRTAVAVQWRDHGLKRSVDIRRDDIRQVAGGVPDLSAFDGRAVAEALRYTYPGLEVDRELGWPDQGASAGSWSFPAWAFLPTLVAMLLTLGQIITGPQPLRATKWGWFWWWFALPVVGAMAFLLVGGAARGRSYVNGRRMGGVVAFVLANLAASVLSGAVLQGFDLS